MLTIEPEVKRGRGRPRRGERPQDWEKYFMCARIYYDPALIPVRTIANTLNCSTDRIADWVRMALSADGEKGEEIRAMARASRRRIKPGPLEGTVRSYSDPNEPAVPPDDWEANQ